MQAPRMLSRDRPISMKSVWECANHICDDFLVRQLSKSQTAARARARAVTLATLEREETLSTMQPRNTKGYMVNMSKQLSKVCGFRPHQVSPLTAKGPMRVFVFFGQTLAAQHQINLSVKDRLIWQLLCCNLGGRPPRGISLTASAKLNQKYWLMRSSNPSPPMGCALP